MANEPVTVRDLVAAVFHDPWRKLVSLALAVLLWQYLDAQVSDSDVLGLTLKEAHEAGDLDTSGGQQRLFVRMDLNKYSRIAFENAQTGTAIEGVSLSLGGAKRLIQTLDENSGFSVQIEPTLEQGKLVATFGREDVRAVNARFEGLIEAMDPPRIRVVVGLNVERSVILRRDRIEFVPPANLAGLGERLIWEDAQFQPEAVKLRGPEPVVATLTEQGRLFRFAPDAPAAGAVRVEAALRALNLEAGVTVTPDTVSLKVPLRVQPHTFRLLEVPVILNGPRDLRERFQLRRDTADVEIEAYRSLEARLSGLSQDEIRDWIHENDAVLVATLPRDAAEPDVIPNPKLILRDYVERTDFRVTDAPTIHFDRKNP